MKLFVTAKPNAKENRVEAVDSTHLIVRVKAKPDEGKANLAVLQVLAAYFKVPKSRLLLVSGFKSRKKIIELNS